MQSKTSNPVLLFVVSLGFGAFALFSGQWKLSALAVCLGLLNVLGGPVVTGIKTFLHGSKGSL